MRCSICDRKDTKFVYDNWHCSVCEDIIRNATGEYVERDMFDLFEDDEELLYEDTPNLS